MQFRFPYRPGDQVILFKDWQTQKKPESVGRLIRKISDGLPYILETAENERVQKVFSYELWAVEIEGHELVRRIPYLHGIGKFSSRSSEKASPPLLDDDFLYYTYTDETGQHSSPPIY